jgi:hypothetical protein
MKDFLLANLLKKRIFVLMVFLTGISFSKRTNAQLVSTYYTFTQSSGTYTPATAGFIDTTGLATTTPASIFTTGWDDRTAIFRLPFDFTFNGTLYAAGTGRIGLDSDAWFCFSNGNPTMTGQLGGGSWVSISDHTGVYLNGTANNNGFAGFNADLNDQTFVTFTANRTSGSNTLTAVSSFTNIQVGTRLSGTGIPNGTIVTAFGGGTITMSAAATSGSGTSTTITPYSSIIGIVSGTAPNRVFTIQWTQAKRYGGTGTDLFNFQMRINEAGGVANLQTLQVIYGSLSATSTTILETQVGLRGAAATDFNARTSSTAWASTTAAVANTNTVRFSNTIVPASGLTFTWSPCTVAPGAAGAIAGPSPVCPGTTQNYSISAVSGASSYAWTYSGTGVTFSATTGSPSNSFVFSAGATGGTISVTPTNLCGTGTPATKAITVTSITPATITYPAASYCTSTAGTVAVTRTGPAGGTYTTSPASGLTIVAGTGTITPSTSTPGTYTVIYTYTSSGCSATATTTVTINPPPAVTATASPVNVCVNSPSQLTATVSSGSNYTMSSIAYSLLTPSGTPTTLFSSTYSDNGVSSAIALPFTFTYYGQSITQLYAFVDGYVQLQTADAATTLQQTIPDVATPNNVIALAWDDLEVDNTINPSVYLRYFVNGTAPNRIFVVDYNQLDFWWPGAGNLTGQIRLYESDNHIEIAAATVNDAGDLSFKTMGIENNTGTLGLSPAGRNNAVWNVTNEAWGFYPPVVAGYTYAWSPATYLSNASISNPVSTPTAVSTTNYTVTVTNTTTGCTATANASVVASNPLNGTYTVGVAGNYTTLTAAVNAYNSLCIGGPVVFSLIDNTYPSETFPIVINSNIYQSATNTLTIKPAATKTPTITGNNALGIIKLNGADYITIDGSNTVGGTTRNLTLINTSTNTSTSNIIWIASVNASNGASNNNIKNCIITGNAPTTTFTSVISSGSTLGAVAEAANNNNTYINNLLTKAQTAIAVVGPTGNETGTIISDNTIGSTVAGDKLGWSGIELYQQASATVSNNTIFGITSSSSSITTSGISVFGTANGITINRNKISDIKHTNSLGYGANGIWLASSSTAANVNVLNNFVFDVAAYGYNGGRDVEDNGYGIIVDYGGGYNIYYNTVHLNTNQTANGFPAAINITSFVTTAASVNIKNNIFHNAQTNAGQRYAIMSTAANTVFGTIDYNYYATTGGGVNAGYIGSNRAAIANIQAGFGQNLNSIGGFTISYISATDKHIDPAIASNVTNFKNRGNPIAGITEDFDVTTRNGYTPDMGADEWVDPNYGSWVGKTNTDWLVATNWEANFVPDGTTDVFITGGYTFMPTIATTQAVRNITFSAPVPANTPLLTLNAGTLQVNGIITRTAGTINGVNGTLEMNNPTAAQTIPAGLFVSDALKNLVIGNANASGVTLGGKLDIYRSLTFSASGLRINTGGFLTFKSTATETAWLGNVTGKTVNGSATVERYIPSGTGGSPNHGKSWQFLATPVSGSQTINQAWQDTATAVNQNRYNGFGTQITSDIVGATTLGFDVYTSPGPSMKTYVSATNTYAGVPNTTSTAISNKKGYMIFVRGSRNVTAYNQSPETTVLRVKGPLYTTGANIPPVTAVPAGKFESVGNPYASAIDFLNITKPAAPAVDDVFYVWDPLLYGSWGYGAFQTISAANGWKPNPGGTANYSSASAYTTIQSGQAFMVHSTSGGGNITFTEAAKLSGSQLLFRQPAALQHSLADRQFLRATLYAMINGQPSLADGAVLAIDNEFTNDYTADDAAKLENGGENFGISRHGMRLSLEAHALLNDKDTIFYSFRNMKKTQYQLKFAPENMGSLNMVPYLIDKYLQTNTILSVFDTTTVSFTVDNNPASAAEDRFKIVFRLMQTVPVKIIHIDASRNTDHTIAVNWKVANELDILHYEVERSSNGRIFIKTGEANPLLNNGGSTEYSFTDNKPLITVNYYRIKAISNNGQVQYSAIVKVAPEKGDASITVYPNPVIDNKIQVQFRNQQPGIYNYDLVNAIGQVVYKGRVTVNSEFSSETIDPGTALGKGNYQLRISNESGTVKSIRIQVL